MTAHSTKRSLPIALLRARESVMAPLREMLADSPVNEQKWRVMRVLEESGPLDQKAIAHEACLLLPSLTRMLQTMERDGLVARAADAHDGRKQIVTLTDDGRAVLEQYRDQGRAILNRIEDRLGREKLSQLLNLLEEVRNIDT